MLCARAFVPSCLRDFVTSGAIYSLDGGVTIQGGTTFAGNTANENGGEIRCMARRSLTGDGFCREEHGHMKVGSMGLWGFSRDAHREHPS